MTDENLPPLPLPFDMAYTRGETDYDRYTVEQLRQYARDAVATDRSGEKWAGEVRIAGHDDVIPFTDELEAYRCANGINQIYLADRLKNPDREVLCVATVHPKAPQ